VGPLSASSAIEWVRALKGVEPARDEVTAEEMDTPAAPAEEGV
jgi:hypothetical protein